MSQPKTALYFEARAILKQIVDAWGVYPHGIPIAIRDAREFLDRTREKSFGDYAQEIADALSTRNPPPAQRGEGGGRG